MRSLATLVATAALLGTSAAAWAAGDHPGGHDEHAAVYGEPGDPKAKARTVKIAARDNMRYSPARIAVKRGETIRFEVTNGGELKHETVLGTLAELKEHAKLMQQFPEMEHDDPNAVQVAPGKTGVMLWKFTKAGEFRFGCLMPGHFEAGMHGTIVVRR